MSTQNWSFLYKKAKKAVQFAFLGPKLTEPFLLPKFMSHDESYKLKCSMLIFFKNVSSLPFSFILQVNAVYTLVYNPPLFSILILTEAVLT